MTEEKNLEGLGGWLILVGLIVVFAPIRIVSALFPVYYSIFADGYWEILTTPGYEDYHPLWAPILLGEIVVNGMLVLAWIFAAYLFFSKKQLFPMCFIGIALFSLVFIVVDALVVKIVLPDEPVFDAETVREFSQSLVFSLVWVPYMLTSKRVRATFIR